MEWPDIAVGLILAFGAFRGWRVGLIAELTGIVALVAAIVAAFAYPGMWDGAIHERFNVGAGSAHVVGLLAFAGLAYFIVSAIGFALGRIAKLPIIGTANAALGSALGLAKSAIFVWAVLYVALFFPLSHDLRKDLHRSRLVSLLASQDEGLDDTLRSSLPWFVKPYSTDIFARHRV
jgi:membrane protein required for colicin V production